MTGYVYAIASGDLVKIGWSTNPQKRFSKIASDNGADCDLLGYISGTRDDESEIHQRFAANRVRGEWFARDHEIDSFIREFSRPERVVPDDWHPLKRWRKENSITLVQFAEIVGVDHSSLSRTERGAQHLSWDAMRKIYAATGGSVTPNDLVLYGAAA